MNHEQIPQEVLDKIKEAAKKELEFGGSLHPTDYFRSGGKFGYSLAADQLRKKEHEIARLKNALEIVLNMKVLPEEKDYRFAFNRCWHAANDALSSLPVKQEEDQEEKETAKCSNCGDIIEHPLCASCDMALTMPTNEY